MRMRNDQVSDEIDQPLDVLRDLKEVEEKGNLEEDQLDFTGSKKENFQAGH